MDKYKKVNREDIFQSQYQVGIPFTKYEIDELNRLTNGEKLSSSYRIVWGLDNNYIIKIYKIEDDYYGVVFEPISTLWKGEYIEHRESLLYFIADQFDGLLELINDTKIKKIKN